MIVLLLVAMALLMWASAYDWDGNRDPAQGYVSDKDSLEVWRKRKEEDRRKRP